MLLRGSAAAILLVDDDEQVRGTIGAMLRDLGYAVREAGDGEEALAALDQEAGLDILLTDLVMPEMNGSQLAIAGDLAASGSFGGLPIWLRRSTG